MTQQIALTLTILAFAVILLIFERLRPDLVSLLVLLSLVFARLVTPTEALSGFSNPAVVTVWAMFILSAGLARTGVANLIGRGILRLGGQRESRIMLVLMLICAGLSGFMNSTGLVAMFLPVVNHITRKKKISASVLLMPVAIGALLGGTTTLISTPPNILVSNALTEFNGQSFAFFDFLRVGILVVIVGIAFMVIFGRRLLPQQTGHKDLADAGEVFGLEERLFSLRLPEGSLLAGHRLSESRLGSALKLNVIGITSRGRTALAPGPNTQLHSGDELLVLGKSDWLEDMVQGQHLILEASNHDRKPDGLDVSQLISPQIVLIEVSIPQGSNLIGNSLAQANFRKQFRANVLAIWRGEKPVRTNFQDIVLKHGDRLLVQASRSQVNKLSGLKDFVVTSDDAVKLYQLEDRLLRMAVPASSRLVGKSLADSELADAFGLSVLGIIRKGKTRLMPRPGEKLQGDDQLVVEGKLEDVQVLRALQNLEVSEGKAPSLNELESEEIGLVEAVISPHSTLANKNLRDLKFREKYGLNVLAIWRGGRAFRSNLREMPLHHGDSLLIYGDRNHIKLLADEGQFLVLSQDIQEAPKKDKALLAAVIMAAVVASVAIGFLPIAIAAIAGAALMVVTHCLNMEEAQKSIQWPAIFLIAGMLPMGLALQNSGTSDFLGAEVFGNAGAWSTTLLLAVLFLISNLTAQVIPPPIVAVVVSSIVLNGAADLTASPQALLITVALGAGTPFLTPISHPANLLVMGPGGYRALDFLKVGLPLTLFILAVTVVAVPFFWPL